MNRRRFLGRAAVTPLLLCPWKKVMPERAAPNQLSSKSLTLLLCGDVMTGRGIDQVLLHPSDPRLYEPYVRDARRYVEIAEQANGPIAKPVDFPYIWGDALDALERRAPDARIINLETSVTTSAEFWPGKGIQYRMHPKNVPCITAAGIDGCVLANNHVMDWGYAGLDETLKTLRGAGLKTAGAGCDAEAARAPAVIDAPGKGRVVVFSFATRSSGVPDDWAAQLGSPGVNLLANLSGATIEQIGQSIRAVRRSGDLVVASIHWGGNWGYRIPGEHVRFAQGLIDSAGVDVVHGHSSHHPLGIEVYKNKPIIYGCGDLLNDYEGIGGYEQYRGDLALMYFPSMVPGNHALGALEMVPMRIEHFRLCRASENEVRWLRDTLNRESERFGSRIESTDQGTLTLDW